mmetsp:Transcript_7850/g.48643  ORF Transcript_7850/g.48643 Transcript_7850/m.48643 type:complete len:246 (-) Transcript_7850:118-855(-)
MNLFSQFLRQLPCTDGSFCKEGCYVQICLIKGHHFQIRIIVRQDFPHFLGGFAVFVEVGVDQQQLWAQVHRDKRRHGRSHSVFACFVVGSRNHGFAADGNWSVVQGRIFQRLYCEEEAVHVYVHPRSGEVPCQFQVPQDAFGDLSKPGPFPLSQLFFRQHHFLYPFVVCFHFPLFVDEVRASFAEFVDHSFDVVWIHLVHACFGVGEHGVIILPPGTCFFLLLHGSTFLHPFRSSSHASSSAGRA